MPLLVDCEKLFGTSKLYDILKIAEGATEDEIKKAYYKQSLLVHPDKVPEKDKDGATEKFQCLGKVYTILSNQDTRSLYDETGEVDNETCIPQDREWHSYWRLLFRKITIDDIQEFEKKYKNSDEEKADLKEAYFSSQGDMNTILELVPVSSIDDEPRFSEIIGQWIKEKKVPDFPAFSNESDESKQERKEMYEEERKEAEKELKKINKKNKTPDNLETAIMQRQQNRAKEMDGFLDHLAAKYGNADDSDEDGNKARGKKASGSKRGKKTAVPKKSKNETGKASGSRGGKKSTPLKRPRSSSEEEQPQRASKRKKASTPAPPKPTTPKAAKSAANGKTGKASKATNGTQGKRGRKK